jgi:streptogramin lyase
VSFAVDPSRSCAPGFSPGPGAHLGVRLDDEEGTVRLPRLAVFVASLGRIVAIVLFSAGAGLTSPASAQTISEFPIPTSGSYPWGIAAGPDGNLWFTENLGNKIGRITPAGAITEFAIPTSSSRPWRIAAGPDGNLWFTENLGFKIGRITPAGAITEFSIPLDHGFKGDPQGIAAGSDGNLWFTENQTSKIGRITPAGVITEFAIPTGFSRPWGIAAGPDGNLWFTEMNADKIGRITPAGVITEFPIPTTGYRAWDIAAGPDGNLWFTRDGRIGQMTPAGVMITEFPVPAMGSPTGIATGPDGNLWFTERSGNNIGRLVIPVSTSFFTVTPCRAFDSRVPGLGGPSPLAAGSQTPVPLVGECGVPAEAKAVALNVTVTAATTAGNVRLFADGGALPLVSTLNYVAGQTRANNAVAPLGASGAMAVYVSQASGSVHVIIDVNGYFE